MDVLIIIVLIIAAVILFLVELFVIPGISFAGIAALGCIIFANYYAFANLGTGQDLSHWSYRVWPASAHWSVSCVQKHWTSWL